MYKLPLTIAVKKTTTTRPHVNVWLPVALKVPSGVLGTQTGNRGLSSTLLLL